MLNSRRILTVQQAAGWLQVHAESVRRWIPDGRLPGAMVGATRSGDRIDERDLYRFFDTQTAASPERQSQVPQTERGTATLTLLPALSTAKHEPAG